MALKIRLSRIGATHQPHYRIVVAETRSRRDGDAVETLVFETETTGDSRGTSGFHGRYTRWLDPKSGVWLKADLAIISGAGNFYPQAYRVRSVTTP